MELCVFRAWLRLRTFYLGSDEMDKFGQVLLKILLAFIIVVTTAGVVRYHFIIICIGPVTMGLLILAILLFIIGLKKEYKSLRGGAVSSFLLGIWFVAGYMIMCLITGEDIEIFDFLLYCL